MLYHDKAQRHQSDVAPVTLAERLAVCNGRPAGFDYLRFGLAAMIVVFHTVAISDGTVVSDAMIFGVSRPLWGLLLPMFFALSGFLVSGSLERSRTLVGFLGLRVIRLVPALAVESTIALLVLGPLFTTLSLAAYFANPGTWHYLTNIVGQIRYSLPGVFTTNPAPFFINRQLWTLPYELKCYGVISVLSVLSIYRRAAGALVVAAVLQAYVGYEVAIAADRAIVAGPVLVLAFVAGVLLYRFRDHVRFGVGWFAASAVLGIVLLTVPHAWGFCALPVAYFTVYLGLTNPPRSVILSSGDYSYGIFLYGYPIQQAIAALFPDLHFWWFNLIVAGPLVAAVAWLSWHVVEQPALDLRPRLKAFETWLIPYGERLAAQVRPLIPAGLRARWAR